MISVTLTETDLVNIIEGLRDLDAKLMSDGEATRNYQLIKYLKQNLDFCRTLGLAIKGLTPAQR